MSHSHVAAYANFIHILYIQERQREGKNDAITHVCKNIPHNCHELSPEHTHTHIHTIEQSYMKRIRDRNVWMNIVISSHNFALAKKPYCTCVIYLKCKLSSFIFWLNFFQAHFSICRWLHRRIHLNNTYLIRSLIRHNAVDKVNDVLFFCQRQIIPFAFTWNCFLPCFQMANSICRKRFININAGITSNIWKNLFRPTKKKWKIRNHLRFRLHFKWFINLSSLHQRSTNFWPDTLIQYSCTQFTVPQCSSLLFLCSSGDIFWREGNTKVHVFQVCLYFSFISQFWQFTKSTLVLCASRINFVCFKFKRMNVNLNF